MFTPCNARHFWSPRDKYPKMKYVLILGDSVYVFATIADGCNGYVSENLTKL